MTRRIFQLTAAARPDGSAEVYAICNDGTAWELLNGQWVQLPPIPQDEAKDPSVCEARQQSDQVICERCNIGWDMNDICPPACGKVPKGERT